MMVHARNRGSHRLRAALAGVLAWYGTLAASPGTTPQSASQVDEARPPSPYVHFGFHMGDDRQLAGWTAIREYFARVDAASDRVTILDIGTTTEGRPMVAALVSAPENLARLAEIQAANKRLADPRSLTDEEAEGLMRDHKAILAIGCSIHASEIGATQAVNEILYELATSQDSRTLALLREAIVILMPSLNPDGHDTVVDWYTRQRGTPFETAPMPWLYHKYAGHDINRDAFMLNLQENRNIARFFYTQWHPHVFLAMHQMGTNGPRFFVPPNYDPIDPNYDPLIWRTAGLLGYAMALEMEGDGRSGVINHAMYDYYWPGYEDSAPLGHNTVCLLTEVASAAIATPIVVAPGELQGTSRGLPEHRAQINYPNPWPGGPWRLRDIVDYELSAVHGLLSAVTRYRPDIVRNFYLMGRRAIDAGERGGPYAFVLPPDQRDPHAATTLVNLLVDGGVDVRQAIEPFSVAQGSYPAGTHLVLMGQPFRAYAKTLLERQQYPVRRLSPDAAPERPYDVAGWTLPYQMGVRVDTIDAPFETPPTSRVERAGMPAAYVLGERRPRFYMIEAPGTTGTLVINRLLAAGLRVDWTLAETTVAGQPYPAGSLVVRHSNQARRAIDDAARTLGVRAIGVRGPEPANVQPLAHARTGLYKPWLANIDEGWTRLLLERFGMPFESVTPERMRRGDLRSAFDVIVLPDEDPRRLRDGHRPESVPAEYAGGLGDEGTGALRAFVEAGGTLVCLDSSCGLVIEALGLPITDVTRAEGAGRSIYAPGSILRIESTPAEPLAFGLPASLGAFFASSAAFEARTDALPAGVTIRTAARYAPNALLMSGWLEGAEQLAGRGAVLDVRAGAGRVVLLGVRAQHRGQTYGTFRLLFNALYTNHRPGA